MQSCIFLYQVGCLLQGEPKNLVGEVVFFAISEWMNSSCCCFLNSSCAVVSAGGGLHCIWQRKLRINMCIMEEKHYRKTVICILQGNNPLSLLGLQ